MRFMREKTREMECIPSMHDSREWHDTLFCQILVIEDERIIGIRFGTWSAHSVSLRG